MRGVCRALVVVIALLLLPQAEPCGRRRRRRPPPDVTPPTIRCPADIQQIADDRQIYSTKVRWAEPQASDNRDGPITPTRTGLGPGKVFYEPGAKLSYTAKDRAGNYITCSFQIDIKVVRCPPLRTPQDGWLSCEPSHDMLKGTRCIFGCYKGFELLGAEEMTCIDPGTWSDRQPYCKAITCSRLFEENDKTRIVCTDGNKYRSICHYSCVSGFDILPGNNRARVCNSEGAWSGRLPECVDISPPEFLDCPAGVIDYAERSKTRGRVVWTVPRYTDNAGTGGVQFKQLSGPRSGDEIPVGEHIVSYVISDAENNTATCDFKVVVKQITCQTLYPHSYTYVTCPQGKLYGSTCTFSCRNGTTLDSPALVQCESQQHSQVKVGTWSFGSRQPRCNMIATCTKPDPPTNGALVCDTWAGGRYCQIQCRQGYLVTENMDSLLVCRDSKGVWDQLGEENKVPNCNKATYFYTEVLSLELEEYFYFDGDCEVDKEEIKQNFLDAISNRVGNICSYANCSVGTVEVLCGNFTDRKRRSVDSNLRIVTSLSLSGTGPDVAEVFNTRTKLLQTLAEEVRIVTSTGSAVLQDVSLSQPKVTCPAGSYADKYTLNCVECLQGSYHDKDTKTCKPCQRGDYQPLSGQTSCLPCPQQTTTTDVGATSQTHCIAACAPGYSSFNGVPPCSPCDVGTYSMTYGVTECTVCPGQQTTNIMAAEESTSSADCFDFDIEYLKSSENPEIASAHMTITDDVTSFQLGLWLRCDPCDKILSVQDADNVSVIVITHNTTLAVALFGCNITTTTSLLSTSNRWHNLLLTVNETGSCVYVDGDLVSYGTQCTADTRLTSALKISVGGPGYTGRVSQLNMYSGVSILKPATSRCFSNLAGDLVSWRDFHEAQGSFLITRSQCDETDNCESNPCHNAGSCLDRKDSFLCLCQEGFTGDTCGTNIDDCLDNTCENGAMCQDGINGYTCECQDGFTGELCETQVVDGSWAEWGPWGPCSVTCDVGVHERSRACSAPSPDNGGKYCDGEAVETSECVMSDTCINECRDISTDLEHGQMNCTWTDSTEETRVCHPYCDTSYAFDSDLFLAEIVCGPLTGFTWNIRNDENPEAQIPACTEILLAETNVLNYTAEYGGLTVEVADSSGVQVSNIIETTVHTAVSAIPCVKTGACTFVKIDVLYDADDKSVRRRRAIDLVGFSVQISCTPQQNYSECYDLLYAVKLLLDKMVNSSAFSVLISHVTYDVIFNDTLIDGDVTCKPGAVPADYFCVECGPGSYQYRDYCERCPRGTYSSVPGASRCKSCPEGWSTLGLQTRNSTGCSVKLPPEDDQGLRLVAIILLCLLVPVIAMLVAAAYAVFQRNPAGKTNTEGKQPLPQKSVENRNIRFAWQDFHGLVPKDVPDPNKFKVEDSPGLATADQDKSDILNSTQLVDQLSSCESAFDGSRQSAVEGSSQSAFQDYSQSAFLDSSQPAFQDFIRTVPLDPNITPVQPYTTTPVGSDTGKLTPSGLTTSCVEESRSLTPVDLFPVQ